MLTGTGCSLPSCCFLGVVVFSKRSPLVSHYGYKWEQYAGYAKMTRFYKEKQQKAQTGERKTTAR